MSAAKPKHARSERLLRALTSLRRKAMAAAVKLVERTVRRWEQAATEQAKESDQ